MTGAAAALLLLAIAACGGKEDASESMDAGLSQRPAVLEARIVTTGATTPALYAEVWGGGAGDSLVAVEIEGTTTSLHIMEHADGMMTMRPVSALPVPDGAPLSLRAGQAHGMVHGAEPELMPGDSVVAAFRFVSGVEVRVVVPVLALTDAVGGATHH